MIPKISSCHKNVSYAIKSINIRRKSFYHWFYAAATAVNDDRILRLFESYDFLAAEARYHKTCYVQYMKQAKQVVQKSQYEIAEEERVTCLMKYIRKEFYTGITGSYDRFGTTL